MIRFLVLLIPFVPKGRIRHKLRRKKDSTLMRMIGVLLRLIGIKDFMTKYTTTVFETIYVPYGQLTISAETLEHEKEHIRQLYRWGIIFWLLYLFALPLFFNPSRAYWEAKAYRIGGTKTDQIIKILSGPAYGYCMPAWILRLFLKA